MKKGQKVILIILNIIMAILYVGQAYCFLQTIPAFPCYTEDGGYLMSMALLWIPVCLITLINVILRFCFGNYNKALICIACLNALYIPAVFLLGYVNITELWVRIIGICSFATMILYYLLSLIFALKNKNKEFDFKNRNIL